jgi:hypothetical protein
MRELVTSFQNRFELNIDDDENDEAAGTSRGLKTMCSVGMKLEIQNVVQRSEKT